MTLDFAHQFVPGAEKSGRTLLLLHGTGGNEHDMLGLGRRIDPEAALLSPRGKVNENGNNRFFRRLAEGIFDEGDVVRRSHELANFLSAATTEYEIDTRQMVAVGYSNGANIASAMMLLGVAPFSFAILLRAMVPLTKTELTNGNKGRVLISEGESDPISPPAGGSDLAKLLRDTGLEVDLIVQPSGHHLIEEDIVAAQRWLKSL